jgi:hypothetical protein
VILTALAAVLAFIPLTESVFWGSMAYTLIGGTAVGTALILVFLPALYAIWFRVRPLPAGNETPLSASPSGATSAAVRVAPYGSYVAKLSLSASLEGQGPAGGLAAHSEIRFISPCECRRLIARDRTH